VLTETQNIFKDSIKEARGSEFRHQLDHINGVKINEELLEDTNELFERSSEQHSKTDGSKNHSELNLKDF